MAYPFDDGDSMNNQPRRPATVGGFAQYAQGPVPQASNSGLNDPAVLNDAAAALVGNKKKAAVQATGTPIAAAAPATTAAPPLVFKGNSPADMAGDVAGAAGAVGNAAAGFAPIAADAARAGYANVNAAPSTAAKVGQAVRGAGSVIGGFMADLGSKAANAAAPVLNAAGTAITGSNEPFITPDAPVNTAAAAPPNTAAAKPTAVKPVPQVFPSRAADSQAAYPAGSSTVPVPNGYTGPQGNPMGFDPTITKSVDANGRVLYSNQGQQSNADLMAKNVVTPAASGFATDASPELYAARRAAIDRGDIEAVRSSYGGNFNAPPQPAPGSQMSVVPDSSKTVAAPAIDMSGLSANQRATLQTQLATNAANNATSRANTTDTTSVTREGQQLNAKNASERLALDTQHSGYANAKTAAETRNVDSIVQAHQTLEAAKQGYAAALATGDAKKTQKAEDGLRAAQGKWEKAAPSGRIVVVQGGTTLGPNGENIHQPSQVYDAEQQKWLTPPPQQGNAPAPAPKGIAEGTISNVNGKKAIFQNGKWVPQ